MYDEESSNKALRATLTTQRKTRRRSKLHPQKQRSKYICKPESVIEAGNHFVWEFSPGRGTINVPADSAILHHYRVILNFYLIFFIYLLNVFNLVYRFVNLEEMTV